MSIFLDRAIGMIEASHKVPGSQAAQYNSEIIALALCGIGEELRRRNELYKEVHPELSS